MKPTTTRIISAVLAGIIVVGMLLGMLSYVILFAGAAESKAELKDKLGDLELRKEEVSAKIASLNEQVADVEATRAALLEQIDITTEEIETVMAYIARLDEQIDLKTTELGVAEQALSEKEALFATRVRMMYEQSDTTYLDILLNSSSFSNMLSRLEIVTQIMDYDKKVVTEYRDAKEDIAIKRDELQKTQNEQKDYQENLKYKQAELQASEREQAALQESIEAYKREQESEYERIRDEMDAVSDRIAELSRQEAAAAAAAGGGGSGGGGSGTTLYSDVLTWPVPGYTNGSGYGWRIHPIYGTNKFHRGEDIPAPTGTSILAAQSGTVTTAGWVSGYGNYTVINHGGGLVTAYGHQSSIGVSVGQTVSAGQVIGRVGSTGNSTGPHLHFEVYVGGQTQDPMQYFR